MHAPDDSPMPVGDQPPVPGQGADTAPVAGQPPQQTAPSAASAAQPYPAYPPYGYPAYPPYGYPPHPGQPPIAYPPHGAPTAAVPPVASSGAGVPPASAGPGPHAAHAEPRKSGRAWMWWLAGTVAVLVVFGCLFATIATIASDKSPLPGEGNTIAVIPMDGTIAGTGVAPSVITPDAFLKLLQRAEDDSNVRAIVLRVNSPGGTVAASEEIATYVKQASKPVVVSVGDIDASGAYMVSSQADSIVANPGSAVGSIGVIMEIPNASGLLDKLGVQFKVITAGKYKDAGSPYRALTPEETALLQGQVDQVYGQFIDIVAEGRDMPRADVEKLATGWAWNGVEAKKLGLVDKIGTYQDALKVAAGLGKIQGGYQTDVYDESQLSGILGSLLGIQSQLEKISASNPVNPASAGGSALAK